MLFGIVSATSLVTYAVPLTDPDSVCLDLKVLDLLWFPKGTGDVMGDVLSLRVYSNNEGVYLRKIRVSVVWVDPVVREKTRKVVVVG